jgi:hypothetical protein
VLQHEESDPMSEDRSADSVPAHDDSAAQKQVLATPYDSVAPTFDSVGPRGFGRVGEQVVALAGIHSGAVVIDVVTGRGATLFPAARAVGLTGRVMGVDISGDGRADSAGDRHATSCQRKHPAHGRRSSQLSGRVLRRRVVQLR